VGSNPTADMSFVPERRASPGALPSSCRKVENDPPTAFPRAQRGRSLRIGRGTGSRGGDCLARGAFNSQPNRQSVTSLLLRSPIPSPWQVLLRQTGYSSVGRASDCRMLQQSDGPWFDSGWPDFHTPHIARGLEHARLTVADRILTTAWQRATHFIWQLSLFRCILVVRGFRSELLLTIYLTLSLTLQSSICSPYIDLPLLHRCASLGLLIPHRPALWARNSRGAKVVFREPRSASRSQLLMSGRKRATSQLCIYVCKLDTLGIEPRASRMLSGCDTTTPCAL
jgi:hypothetical protein